MTTNVTPAILQPGLVLSVAPQAGIIGSASSQTIIKRVVFSNSTNAVVTIGVSRKAAGVAALVIIYPRNIPAGGTDLAPELANMVLLPGDQILAIAGAAASINMFASGYIAS